MSADSSILIVRLCLNGKYIWVVLHVQAVENFAANVWLEYYLTRTRQVQYTNRRNVAVHIARKMARERNVEHGIVEIRSTLAFSGKAVSSEQGKLNFDYTVPDDWTHLDVEDNMFKRVF